MPTLKSKGSTCVPPPGMSRQWYFTTRTWKCPISNCPLLAGLAGVLGHIPPRLGTAVLSLCQHGWEAHTLGPAGRPGHVWTWATDTAQPLLCIPSTFQDGSKGHTESQGSGEQRLPSHLPSLLGLVGLSHMPQAAYNRPLAPRVGPTSGFLFFLDKVHQARGPSHQLICCYHSPLSGL